MIILTDIDRHYSHIRDIEAIYNPSFPDDERVPFTRLLYSLNDTKIMSAALVDDIPVGMITVFLYEDIVYLAYLVVDPKTRGKGYGTEILRLLKEKYPDRRIVIDIEQQDPNADNAEERHRRRDFYFRNGYTDTGARYFYFNVHYDLLSSGGKVKASEFRNLIQKHWGIVTLSAVFSEADV